MGSLGSTMSCCERDTNLENLFDDPIHGDATRNGLRHLSSVAEKTILDLGCGKGEISVVFARFAGNVYCIDIDHQALTAAKHKLESEAACPFLTINAKSEALPIATESVDVVFSRSTLQYTEITSVLAEIRRILRVGGLLILNENLPSNVFVKAYRLRRFVRSKFSGDTIYIDTIRHYLSHNDVDSLQPFFRIVSLRYFHLCRPLTIRLIMTSNHASAWLINLDRFLKRLDEVALAKWPFLQHYAWIVSVVAVKEAKT
jgi:ubiquinone/menaquinone biosynthesis C-methylase UbiE